MKNYEHALQKLWCFPPGIQQNWVCIFMIFLWFSTDFLSSSTRSTTIQDLVYKWALGFIELFTDLPLVYSKVPGKDKCSAIGSLDRGAVRPESDEADGALGRGIGGKGQGGHLRSIRARSWGQGCLGDGVRTHNVRWSSEGCGATRDALSSYGTSARCWKGHAAEGVSKNRSSPRRRPWRLGGAHVASQAWARARRLGSLK
jgi:hypothetical protein